jgi:hypothetical protein
MANVGRLRLHGEEIFCSAIVGEKRDDNAISMREMGGETTMGVALRKRSFFEMGEPQPLHRSDAYGLY